MKLFPSKSKPNVQSDINESEERVRDMRHLRSLFYQNYDRSLCEAALDRQLGIFLGDGYFFESYLIEQEFPLVVKKPKPHFVEERLPHQTELWLKSIKKLSTSNLPLMGPIEVLYTDDDEFKALVMPFGHEVEESKISPHWTPLKKIVNESKERLKKLGYVNRDLWQLRQCRQIPFLIDVSDLDREQIKY